MPSRRKAISIYFLCTAIPCGLVAIVSEYMILGMHEWSRLVSWAYFLDALWRHRDELTMLILINFGFLLLIGYARFTFSKKPVNHALANMFWSISFIYNLADFGLFIEMNKNSYDLRWIPILFIPAIGALLSARCVEFRSRPASTGRLDDFWRFVYPAACFLYSSVNAWRFSSSS